MFRCSLIELLKLAVPALLVTACAAANPMESSSAEASCIQTSIAELGNDPRRYADRRVCVSGYLGRMVPHGETRAELFSSQEEARTIHADLYLHLRIRLDLEVQARLARYSTQPARVEGIFEYDPRCWPGPEQQNPSYNCFPPRPMKIRQPRIVFEDGTEF